jgi:CRISPR system Cascade subunit CasD
MMEILILRFDAPLVSFGGVQVDQRGVTREFPGRSMLTGLVANALGYDHSAFEQLQRLQVRLRYAVRRDRAGTRLIDFQTVDLGQDFMREGWTTRGAPEGRGGGSAKAGTHIRYRHYLADALYTLAFTLDPAEEEPSLDRVEAALREPERPLFLGRKCCLPATPLVVGRTSAISLGAAVRAAPPVPGRTDVQEALLAWWPVEEGDHALGSREVPVTDERDWANQVHVGRRFFREGRLPLEVGNDH